MAFGGFDPVAVRNYQALMKGLPQYVSYYRGGFYHFTCHLHKTTFDASPSLYAPQFGGYSALSMANGKLKKADVNTWSISNDRLIVLENQAAVSTWNLNASENLKKAETKWPKINAKTNKKD